VTLSVYKANLSIDVLALIVRTIKKAPIIGLARTYYRTDGNSVFISSALPMGKGPSMPTDAPLLTGVPYCLAWQHGMDIAWARGQAYRGGSLGMARQCRQPSGNLHKTFLLVQARASQKSSKKSKKS
jgi:hypothetical protein